MLTMSCHDVCRDVPYRLNLSRTSYSEMRGDTRNLFVVLAAYILKATTVSSITAVFNRALCITALCLNARVNDSRLAEDIVGFFSSPPVLLMEPNDIKPIPP